MMILGDTTCTTGLALRVHSAMNTALGTKFDATDATGKQFAFAMATAIYTILTTDAQIVVAAGGLQTSAAPGAPTGAPAAPVILVVT